MKMPCASLSLLIVCLCIPAATFAQQPGRPSGPLTLEQVLQLASERSESVAIARAGIDRAEAERARSRAGRLPQLSASASYDRALASEFADIFERDGGSIFGGADTDDVADLPFGRENTWRFNLLFSQSLFSGGRFAAQAAIADAGRDSATLALSTARAQLLFEVTQAYYDAALADRLVAIAEATVGQAEEAVKQVQAGFQAGTQPEFELLRATVSRDTQTPTVIRQRANRDIALLRLKQLLDLPADVELQLAGSLDDEALPPPATFGARLASFESMSPASAVPSDERTAIKEATVGVQLREAALRAARAERMPNVSLTSNFSRVAYPSNAVPWNGDFRTNWTVGAAVEVPVLTGGRIAATEAVARADVEQARLQLRQVEELAALDTQLALAELAAARSTWDASGSTVRQASRAYQIATVRFSSGVSTQLELSDARLLLQQAETNRAQAARDLQVARARLALLPDLPVGGGTLTAPRTPIVPPQMVPPAQPAPGGDGIRRASAPQTAPTGGRQ